VVPRILSLLAWMGTSALKAFQNHFKSKQLSVMTLMLTFGGEIMARSILSMEKRLTIAGWYHILHGSSGNIAVTSMWSASPQSKPSSTSTNMCTKAMITQLWSLEHVRMRSNNILMLAMCLPVKLSGESIIFTCTRSAQVLFDCRSIFQISS